MNDLILLAIGLTLTGVGIDYLRNHFAQDRPEFLPFLKVLRWFILVVGSLVLIGSFISLLADMISSGQ
jgi:uncharacterized protein involved in cysteine biosynthesis